MPEEPSATPKSKWNIMVYIVGDRSLSGTMISQLKELTDAGFQKDTHVLAFFDPNSYGKKARIFNVNRLRKLQRQRHQETATIIGDGKDPFVRDIAEDYQVPSLPNLAAAIRLRYFLTFARTYYPAENYVLFLMGHGVIVANDTFLPDPDDPTGGIKLTDLGWLLKNFAAEVKEDKSVFQLVGFHSCSMNSVELLHDLGGSARYMMGTQGSANPGSWPYRQLLKKMFGVIEESKKSDASAMFDEDILPSLQSLSFYNSQDYWLAGYSADLAVCNLEPTRINRLQLRISQLARALKAGLKDRGTRDAIQLAHLKSQSYWAENFTDLYDFCKCLLQQSLGSNGSRTAITAACEDVMSALYDRDDSVVRYSDYYGPAYQFSHGLSIYFPWRSPDATIQQMYANYNFTSDYKEDSWWSFLKQYFEVTQRQPQLRDGLVGQRRVDMTWTQACVDVRLARWATKDILREMPDKELLAIAPINFDKVLEPPDKVLEPPDKVLEPPDKVLEPPDKVLEPPDKVLEPPDKVLEPPDKVLEPPDKVLGFEGFLEPPDKVLEPPDKVLEPPDKVLEPPDKLPGLGPFGSSVIKNFYSPDDVFVTSRPHGFYEWKCQHQGTRQRERNGNYKRH